MSGTDFPAADRNLLFGILALQMDFISRDDLIASMHEWVLAKSRTLGDILVAQHRLTAERQQLLDALVAEHIRAHGNNPQQSLASTSTVSSIRDDLQAIDDEHVQASLGFLASEESTNEKTTTLLTLPPPVHAHSTLRYRTLRFHAKGGLGQVYVAEDCELHREVALKEIREDYLADPHSKARFLLEAEITGRLEHPGVVPVYGLGYHDDGRPFYAMRFIKGDNLKKAIEEFHQGEDGRRDSGQRSLAFRSLLGRFVDVCNAIAYAHSRGILHRDLKPGNVMLGKYGETLVVDWGLAKPMNRHEGDFGHDEATLRPSSKDSNLAVTQAGTTIGTPSYMSPEQAAGRLDAIGPASDIYSLGATLYALLTGQAPFRGKDVKEIIDQVQHGQFPRPTQVKPSTPKALEAICLKAMALRPQDRYTSALELAADIEHWLADEPVSAWTEPMPMKLARWLRKHRTIVTSGAVMVIVSLVALVIGLVLVSSYNQQLAQANTELMIAESEADEKRKEAEAEKQVALAVRNFLQFDLLRQADATEQANRLLRAGGGGFEVLENPTIRELLDRAAAELTPEKIEKKFPNQPLVQAEILRTIGECYRGTGEFATAIDHLNRSYKLFVQTRGPEHAETLTTKNNLAEAYYANGEPEKALPLLEETFKIRQSKLGESHPDTLSTENNLAEAYQALGDLDKALPMLERILEIRKRVLGPDAPNTLASQNNLGEVYHAAARLPDAIRLLKQTLESRISVLGPKHPDTLDSLNNLAGAYWEAGEVEKALPLFEEALEARKDKLGADHPNTLNSQGNLGAAYESAGQLDKAETLFRSTLVLARKRYGEENEWTHWAMALLGRNLLKQKKYAAAEPILRQCLKIRQKMIPGSFVEFYTRTLVGEALMGLMQYDDAEKLLLEGYKGMKSLEKSTPPQVFAQQMPLAIDRLIRLYDDWGRTDQAEVWRQRKKELNQK